MPYFHLKKMQRVKNALIYMNAHWLTKLVIGFVGLIPFVSGVLSFSAARHIKETTTPPPLNVVKKIEDGTPQQVWERHKAKRKEFKELHSAVRWDELKKLNSAAQEEKARAPQSTTKAVKTMIGRYTRYMHNKEIEDCYSSEETMPSGYAKPKKLFVSLPSDADPEGRDPHTAIYMDREQEKRWDLIEGRIYHEFKEETADGEKSTTYITNWTSELVAREEPDFITAMKDVIFRFFKHSKIRSATIVANLEQSYAEAPKAKV